MCPLWCHSCLTAHYSPGQETSLDDNIHGQSLERRDEEQAALKGEAVKVSMKLVESFIQRPIPRILWHSDRHWLWKKRCSHQEGEEGPSSLVFPFSWAAPASMPFYTVIQVCHRHIFFETYCGARSALDGEAMCWHPWSGGYPTP